MGEFKAIETQAELDTIVEGRLARQKESYDKQLADYEQLKKRNAKLESESTALNASMEDLKSKNSMNDQTVADLNAKIAGYETANLRTKIALENGLPFDLANRLVGEDEASLKADAERLAGFMKPNDFVPPLRNPESNEEKNKNSQDSAYRELLENLNLEGE